MSEESGSASPRLQPDNIPAGWEVSSKSNFTLFGERTFLWTSGFYFMHLRGCNWSRACWNATATPEACWKCLWWKSKLCWEMSTLPRCVRLHRWSNYLEWLQSQGERGMNRSRHSTSGSPSSLSTWCWATKSQAKVWDLQMGCIWKKTLVPLCEQVFHFTLK